LKSGVAFLRAAVVFGAWLLVSPPERAMGQGAPPAVPDTTLPASAGRPAYLQALHEVTGPVMLGTRPFRVLFAPAATAATLDELTLADSLARACPASGTPVPASRLPGGVALDATKYLVIIVSAAPFIGDGCETRWNDSPLASWSGLSFAAGDEQPDGQPLSMRLLANGVEVPPTYSVARPTLELRNGEWRRGPNQLRYYYPMSVLASTRDGSRPELAVQVWPRRGAATSFDLSRSNGERMQYAYATWRLATTSGAIAPVRLTPRHPVSSEVREVLDLAAAGKTDSAALQAAGLLSTAPSARVSEYDHDVASMLVAEALRQRGDSAGMRGLISSVRARRECLVPPQGSSAALARAVVGVRSGNCPEHNPFTTLGAGIVFPGGGHYLHGSRLIAAIATGAISTVFLSAYSADAEAKHNYALYEASRIPAQATDYFKLANAERSTARVRARVGLMVWGADAVLASFMTAAINRGVAHGRL
jgi:hypothetical protein